MSRPFAAPISHGGLLSPLPPAWHPPRPQPFLYLFVPCLAHCVHLECLFTPHAAKCDRADSHPPCPLQGLPPPWVGAALCLFPQRVVNFEVWGPTGFFCGCLPVSELGSLDK